MNAETKPHAGLAAAMRRSLAFLRAPAERDGQRALHHTNTVAAIQAAAEHAVLAGNDDIAFKLSALRAEADAAFGEAVHAPERAHLEAEIATCDRLLPSTKKGGRR